jgi:quercetin dioxygenase-like cupin family protein
MSEKAYEVAHIDDLDRFPVDNDELLWRPVRRKLGITAFGTNAYTAEKGHERVVEEHYERDGAEELYFVASGRATFTLGDEEIDAPAGTFVYAEPGTKRGALAAEPKTTVVAFGAKRGVPHEISGWEEMFVAFGHLHNGNEDEGRKAMAAAIAAKPDAWQGHFNAACFESLTGNREATFEHLRHAIELDPTAAEYAQKDTDFDWLRDDPEFPA